MKLSESWCHAREVLLALSLLFFSTRPANAQVTAWQAAPGCPAPSEVPVTLRALEGDRADDLSVRVTVTATEGGWRAILEASDHSGTPMGERILEHSTCEDLNRAVLVSLSVLLGTQSPVETETIDPEAVTPNATQPEPATVPATTPTAPTEVPPSPPTTEAPLANAPQTEEVPAQPAQPEREPAPTRQEPSRPESSVMPQTDPGIPLTLDLFPALLAALEGTSANAVGAGLGGLVASGSWGARLGGEVRSSVGAVAEDPTASFWAVSGSLQGCKYFTESNAWLLCVGPMLEQLHGSVPAASRPNATAWLAGGSLSLSLVQREPSNAFGWFASLELHVRTPASFQLGSPSTTIFVYPAVGAALSLGPTLHL